ncbi:MAG: general secretion pathway protein GspB [Candidatus Omnitrophica bacterium]|nr:general secretion pathway protein GspB [Candidatus Omnitrophota bacterium]
MSIIYDALKKIEQARETTQKPESKNMGKLKLKKSNFSIYILYGLTLFLAFAFTNIFFWFLSNHPRRLANPPQKLPTPIISISATPTLSLSETPSPSSSFSKPSLVLNGVFYSQEEGYALINNQILKEGETIEGARLRRINPDGVELEFAGEIIQLSPKTD